jgi:hypothetical protein
MCGFKNIPQNKALLKPVCVLVPKQMIHEQYCLCMCLSWVGIDIDLNIGDIRHPTLTSVILISEENVSDWKLSFPYRRGSDINIWVHSDIRYKKIFITSAGFEPKTLVFSATVLIYEFLDVGYRIKVYSDIRYNVGLRSLQSDIGSSDIKLSPILLITDIGVSAHLWSLCIQ